MPTRVKWVKPGDRPDIESGTQGLLEEKFIILVEGRADELTEMHERAHIGLGHQERGPVTAQKYVDDEVDADLITYAQVGRPRNIIKELRGTVVILMEEWGMTAPAALKLVTRSYEKRGNRIPLRWRSDLARLKRGSRRGEESHFLGVR